MVRGVDTGKCIVTARKVSALPDGFIPAENLVYQYVDITPAGCLINSGIQLEFEVPLSYVDYYQSTIDDIRLYQLRNQSWICLPTTTRGSKHGFALYRGDSPELSRYAIILLNSSNDTPREDTFAAIPTSPVSREESETPVMLDIPGTTPEPLAPFAFEGGFSWMTFTLSMTIMTGLVIGVVLIRKRWIR
jgi:hypothetical protein